MPRRFTLAEARALIPQVEGLLRTAVSLKTEYEEAEQSIQALTERVTMLGGVAVDRGLALEVRTRRESAAARLRVVIGQVQEVGCLIKDLDIGLIDFPSLYRGQDVCLCWKLGEPDIAFWHGPEEGFKGRKPIDDDFLRHHSGDAS